MGYLDNNGLTHLWGKIVSRLVSKQDRLTGAAGQVVGFNEAGEAVARTPTAADVGAVPTTRTVNGKALSANISLTAADVGALASTGTAASATKLATARTIRTNLASTSTASFDGSANVTPGVTGTLPIANGGTGNTTGLAASATKLATARTIDGVAFDGSAAITHYYKCDTAANVAQKDVTMSKLSLVTGAEITVRFTYANTAAKPTISVNGGEAAAIMAYGSTAAGPGAWQAGEAVRLVFATSTTAAGGGYWYIEGGGEAARNVGQSMAGQSVEPTQGTTVTASSGAEIFNDYRARTFDSTGAASAGNVASGSYSHAEGFKTTAIGIASHTEGSTTIASHNQAHAEGYLTTASGGTSHTEGHGTTASGSASHAEGYNTWATGNYSHAEGSSSQAVGTASHAEGNSAAGGNYSHAEGVSQTNASYSHAEGFQTTAKGESSHTEGGGTIAGGDCSHAEGCNSAADGDYSHAEGYNTIASGNYSHASGYGTIASGNYQTAMGISNIESTLSTNKLIIGNGSTSSTAPRSNCFRVTHTGTYATGNYNATGADYAELFEWTDGNPDKEDRVGRFVTLDGAKIRLASPDDDYILGIVSGNPSVVGDVHDDQWAGMYLYDIFGRPLWEDVEVPAQTTERPDSENPEKIITDVVVPAHMEHRQRLNPDYDNTQPYLPRTQRPEWDAVGMLGKLVTVDDGTCQVNGWATVGENGKATASKERTKYRVMERLDESHVRIMIL